MILPFFQTLLLLMAAATVFGLELSPVTAAANAHARGLLPLPDGVSSTELLDKRDVGAYCFPVAGCANGAAEVAPGTPFGGGCVSIKIRDGYQLCVECKYKPRSCIHPDSCFDLVHSKLIYGCVISREYTRYNFLSESFPTSATD